MLSRCVSHTIVIAMGLGIGIGRFRTAAAQDGVVLDTKVAPGQNYDLANFRLWYPKDSGPIQAVAVLVPGSNGDGRDMVEEPVWQAFARQHHLALVGCHFTDKPHELDFIEEYVDVARGSGQALLDALNSFAAQAGHPELASARLLLWGMSAGGEFNYEFAAWKPDRVIAFVLNKGGIYYSALISPAARKVPGFFFIGGQDIEFRNNTIKGLFAVNRRAGAHWALAEESDVAHDVGRSLDLTMIFFDEVLSLRLGGTSQAGKDMTALKEIADGSGFVGEFATKTFQSEGTDLPDHPNAWLPSMRVARAWQALVTGKPFEP
jgi:dienelactone hydrolase